MKAHELDAYVVTSEARAGPSMVGTSGLGPFVKVDDVGSIFDPL